MTLTQKLDALRAALVSVTDECYMTHRPSKVKGDYIVWGVNGEFNSLEADNHKAEQSLEGYVEFHSKNPLNPLIDTIQTVLNSVEGLYFTLSAYETFGDPANDNDNSYHTSFTWRLI